jgi:hypothetical protein
MDLDFEVHIISSGNNRCEVLQKEMQIKDCFFPFLVRHFPMIRPQSRVPQQTLPSDQ